MTNKKPQRTFTAADRAAAKNLRRLWDAKAREKGLTQEKFGDLYGMTQGAVSHYLNGRIALGPVATLRFATALEVDARDIRPDFNLCVPSADLTPEAVEFAYRWLSIPEPFRSDIRRSVDNLVEAGGYAEFLRLMGERKPGKSFSK